MVERGLETSVWAEEPLSSVPNIVYTALTRSQSSGPKNLNQLPIAHQWDLWSLGSQHARAHTHISTRVTETSPPQQRGWEGRTQLQGCREKERDCVKTWCWARNVEWLVYQGKLCNMCEQVAIYSLSHCWLICQLILRVWFWCCFPWIL